MTKLSGTEIQERLVRLRNVERLYEEQKEQLCIVRVENNTLKEENNLLKEENKKLREVIESLTDTTEHLTLRVDELNTMVFGKKKEKKQRTQQNTQTEQQTEPQKKRTAASYRRTIPQQEDVTETQYHTLETCPTCAHALVNKETTQHYEEDIVLPKKRVIAHTVEKGYCSVCGVTHAAMSVPKTPVVIGETVRTYVSYCATILRLSYPQIQAHLADCFNFSVSLGELVAIQAKNAAKHRVHYEELKTLLRAEPVLHIDETSDRVRDGDGYKAYIWGMTGVTTPEVIFSFGRNRGKGVAEELLGTSAAVGVTDNYGAYRNLFQAHQLCFAHLHRKLRDLAESSAITDPDVRNACKTAYEQESSIYTKVRKLTEQDTLSDRQRTYWYNTLRKKLTSLATIQTHDPKKLRVYKETLRDTIEDYLTCIRIPGVPCDNNRAERMLRHVVLKRKTSFGSITARGAETMSILMSVFMTIRNRIQGTGKTFFEEYACLVG
jgi:transposase